MDQTPQAPRAETPAFSGAATVLCTLALLAIGVGVAMRLGDPLALLDRPVATAIRVHERGLALSEASDNNGWARLRGWFVDEAKDSFAAAIAAYGEALAYVADPDNSKAERLKEEGIPTHQAAVALLARRSVTWLAWQRARDAEADLGALAKHPGGAEVARVIAYALAGSSVTVTQPQFDQAIAQLTVSGTLPGEWTETRLRIGFLNRLGGWPLAVTAVELAEQRAQVLLRRADVLAVVYLLLLVGGLLIAVAALVRRRAVFSPLADGIIAAPWLLSEGYAVVVRSLLVGLLLLIGLTIPVEILGLGEVPLGGVWLWLPAMYYVHKALLRPRSLELAPAFGLRSAAGWIAVLACTLALVALEQGLGALVSTVSEQLGRTPAWTDTVYEALLYAGPLGVAAVFVEGVLAAAVFEEIVFRGVVYSSLRTRLSPWASAVLSAALFGVVHGYSSPATLSLFVAAVASALVYERTRSLVPCMLAHAVNNLFAFGADVLLYR